MTTNLQNAIISGSIIGSLLANYDHKECRGALAKIRKDIKKMMFRRSRTNEKEFREAIAIADKAWRDTVNHFAKLDKKMEIEALTSVSWLYNLYAKPLERFANISQKKMELATMKISEATQLHHEQNSYETIDYLIERLAESTGIKRENKLKTRFTIMKQNLILEGKI